MEPEAPAGVVNGAAEEPAGFYGGSAEACTASDFGPHVGQRGLADPDFVAAFRVVAQLIVRLQPNQTTPDRGLPGDVSSSRTAAATPGSAASLAPSLARARRPTSKR